MRFLFRLLSLVSLAAATIAGTLDSIQSIAASHVDISSLAESWKAVSPSSFDHWRAPASAEARLHFYDPVVTWLLAQPAVAVLLAISLLLWIGAYRRATSAGRLTV